MIREQNFLLLRAQPKAQDDTTDTGTQTAPAISGDVTRLGKLGNSCLF